jgi:hypothetical protein
MMALFGNLSFLEIALLAAASVMIFGRNLPRTAAQLYTHFVRARRALQGIWRESGLGDEFRQVQREMEQTAETIRRQSPEVLTRDAIKDVEGQVRAPLEEGGSEPEADQSSDEDVTLDESAEALEGASEETPSEPAVEPPQPKEKPPWYPENRSDPFGVPRDRGE